MSKPLPRPADYRLTADELAELEELLEALARAQHRDSYTVRGRVVDGQATTVVRTVIPWESAAGVRSLELVRELTTTGARQARVGSGGGGAKAPAHEAAVPYVAAANDLAALIHGALADWAAATMRQDAADVPVGPRRPAPRSLEAADLASWLLGRLDDLDARPGSTRPELARLRVLVRRGRGTIDRRPDRAYAGPCNMPLRDAEGSLVIVAGAQARCAEDLYARPKADTVTCRSCGHEHDVELRRAELLRHARERLETAADLSRALSALGNLRCDAARVRQWAKRGRIVAKGRLKDGSPLYRVGDAMVLLEADAVRADKAARKAAATKAAAEREASASKAKSA